MHGLTKFDDSYFEKYRTTPVKIRPFSSKQTEVGNKIISQLSNQLSEFKIEYTIRGSTAFQIAGKGEVEVGVYPISDEWNQVLSKLIEFYGPLEQQEDDYARVNSEIDGIEVEIIILRGHDAAVDKKLHQFMMANPDLLKKYEQLKEDNCFSKRQYMIAKNKFLSEVVDSIPEE